MEKLGGGELGIASNPFLSPPNSLNARLNPDAGATSSAAHLARSLHINNASPKLVRVSMSVRFDAIPQANTQAVALLILQLGTMVSHLGWRDGLFQFWTEDTQSDDGGSQHILSPVPPGQWLPMELEFLLTNQDVGTVALHIDGNSFQLDSVKLGMGIPSMLRLGLRELGSETYGAWYDNVWVDRE